MKDGIHPQYREVVFRDASANFSFLTRSTVRTNQKVTWEDGNEYPLVTVDVSSASHPFYTGKTRASSDDSRLTRFANKYKGKYGKNKDEAPAPETTEG